MIQINRGNCALMLAFTGQPSEAIKNDTGEWLLYYSGGNP